MGNIAEALGRLLAPILIPIIKEALRDFFKDTAEIGQPNPTLQQLWDAGWLRNANDLHSTGNCGSDNWLDEGGKGGGSGCQGRTCSLGGGSSAWNDGKGAGAGDGGEGQIS